jgi:serine/threonine-protein kinase
MQLLAKAPAERPQDATQVLRAIEDVTIATDPPAVTRPTSHRARVSKRIVFGGVSLLVVAAVALLVTLLRTDPGVAPAAPSIAVLPFDNTSGDADDEPFTDGLTAELITALSRVPTLKVAARTSTFALKGKNLDLRTIADTLRVNTLLEGTVRRDRERFKVATQLVDARENRVLWSATYDVDRRDIFAVQEQIARAVATALSVRLTGSDVPTVLAERPTEDFDAYQLYLKGQYFLATRRRAELYRAVQYYVQATQRDPGFARAWAGLSSAYSALGIFGFERPNDVFPKARAAPSPSTRTWAKRMPRSHTS